MPAVRDFSQAYGTVTSATTLLVPMLTTERSFDNVLDNRAARSYS